ncbi:S8 family serine peptidase [Pyxidicoccus parkwayensis]|uniref:S8 family serine peptidase n=1 Tax=Pyxidicoccus parkwayensis TaxID=2813578 RepID=A0ABX7NNG6_9BACT|nr:S8 family serine peptidase [Pyxidicoccus parkwaysis]QSQ19009.1 S8 family serine peptidase [Pyxidicoccus parkwaysis]
MAEQFQSPRVHAIVVLLKAGYGQDWLGRWVFERVGTGWSVCPVPFHPRGDEFDVVPQAGVEPARAWDFARELRALDGVVDAEPTFEALYEESAVQGPTGADPDITPRSLAYGSAGGTADAGSACDWSVKFVQAEEAWALPDCVSRYGQGIRVGHPDSGYRAHPELGADFNPGPGWDFINGDSATENVQGDHGLETASVISSADNRSENERSITGIAAQAEVIPLRVTKPHSFVPAPVLFEAGATRLRDAIRYALTLEPPCHVLSISLGWLPDGGLHRALQDAVQQNVIVIAAAGNYTGRIVVWPAAYPEAIAMAACNAQGAPWWGSARGPAVDATGPGEGVWVANVAQYVAQSDGTSFAVATIAGIAALWLAYHGRDNLLARYAGGPLLSEVFRQVLCASCTSWEQDPGLWGAGLVNARGCLQAPLPDPAAVQGAPAVAAGPVEETFPTIPAPRLHESLARVLGVKRAAIEPILAEHGRELRFWLLTQPDFRRALAESFIPAMEPVVTAQRAALPPFSDGLHEALRANAST